MSLSLSAVHATERILLRRILAASYLAVTDPEQTPRLYLERDWLDLSPDEAALLTSLGEQ